MSDNTTTTKKKATIDSVDKTPQKDKSVQTMDSKPPEFDSEIDTLVDNEIDAAGRPVHVRVSMRQGESTEQMLRRFNYAVNQMEVIKKVRDNQFFEKPSKRRQREEKLRQGQRRYDN